MINSYDIDGVIYLGKYLNGLKPDKNDIIVTGRSYEEKPETEAMLHSKDIDNLVFYNPLEWENKTRESSGEHKANTLNYLKRHGMEIGIHFEDDDVQASIIENLCPWLKVVRIHTPFIEKENVRHAIEQFE